MDMEVDDVQVRQLRPRNPDGKLGKRKEPPLTDPTSAKKIKVKMARDPPPPSAKATKGGSFDNKLFVSIKTIISICFLLTLSLGMANVYP
jgi:hypothetical protein